MASVSLEQLHKRYDNGHVAVKSASFEVHDGELLVLVGPSGCGKSTLLRLIAGLEPISGGELRIDGERVNERGPAERDIAMVFQSYALYPHMTVAENLSFSLRLRGMAKADIATRVAESARMLELEPMLDRLPRQLSGGQRQRVALGRALIRKPRVFLLDEPLSNLDAALRMSMRAEISKLHQTLATTMIYVTHDQIEAMTLGQRIVVLNQGAIQQIDTPMALYQRPANVFVAGFLGSPAINLLRGVLHLHEGGVALQTVDGPVLCLGHQSLLPAAFAQTASREVIVGLRPEHLRLTGGGHVTTTATASVERVEPIGNEAFVALRLGRQPIVLRMPPEQLPAPGSSHALAFDAQHLHLFDAASGGRLN